MKKIKNNSNLNIKVHLASGDFEIPADGFAVMEDYEAEQIMAKFTDSAQQPDQSVKHLSFLEISDYTVPPQGDQNSNYTKPLKEKVAKESKKSKHGR